MRVPQFVVTMLSFVVLCLVDVEYLVLVYDFEINGYMRVILFLCLLYRQVEGPEENRRGDDPFDSIGFTVLSLHYDVVRS